MIRGVRNMLSLKELHLVNIEKLEPHMLTLADCVRTHKALEVLDVRQTQQNLYKRDVSSLVILLNENKVLKEIDISKSIVSKKNM